MSQIYMPRRRMERPSAKAAPGEGQQTAGAPGASVDASGMGGQLDERMSERYRQHFHQIPAAEDEADRLSADIQGVFSPDEVKARMGEAMGADFSDVRFHTGPADAARAEDMGARAYAAGQDVYFGPGGFDAHVAAHELVHTVQQGVVSSNVPTLSTPTGGVQMFSLIEWFKSKFGRKKKAKKAEIELEDLDGQPEESASAESGPEEASPEEAGPVKEDLDEQAEAGGQNESQVQQTGAEAERQTAINAKIEAGRSKREERQARREELAEALPLGNDLQDMQDGYNILPEKDKVAGPGHSTDFGASVNEWFKDRKAGRRPDDPEEASEEPTTRWGRFKCWAGRKVQSLYEKDEEPTGLGGKIKNGFRGLMRTGLDTVSSKYESFMRKQDRAMDDLAMNRENFDKMSFLEKAKWMKSDPMRAVAALRQSRLGILGDFDAIKKISKEQGTKNPFKLAKHIFRASKQWSEDSKASALKGAQEREEFSNAAVAEAREFLASFEGGNDLGDAASGEAEDQVKDNAQAAEEAPETKDVQKAAEVPAEAKDDQAPTEEAPASGDKQEGVVSETPEEKKTPDAAASENTQEEKKDPSTTAAEILKEINDKVAALKELGVGEDVVGALSSGLKAASTANEARRQKDRGDRVGMRQGIADTVAQGSSAVSKGLSASGLVSNDVTKKASAASTIIESGAGIYKSGEQFFSGRKVEKNMTARAEALQNQIQESGVASRDDTRKMRTVLQAKETAGINKVEGGTGMISNFLGLLSGGLKATGAGKVLGKIADWGKKGIDLVSGIITGGKKKERNTRVANEETKVDEKVAAFQNWYKEKHGEALDAHDAKHAIIKAMGFETGKRSEIALNVTGNRAKALADEANSGNDEEAEGIVKDMDLQKGTGGKYNVDAIAERLGSGDKSLEEAKKKLLASRRSTLAKR